MAKIQMTDILGRCTLRNMACMAYVGVIYQDCFKIVATGCRSIIQHSATVPPLHQQVNIVIPELFFAFGEFEGFGHICVDFLDNSKTRRTGDHINIDL